MDRNKGQGQQGLNDNRQEGNLPDSKLNNKDRAPVDDDQRQNSRKAGKTAQGRKGAPGKNNNH